MNSLKPQIGDGHPGARALARIEQTRHAVDALEAQLEEARKAMMAAAFIAMQHRPTTGLTAREISAHVGVSREHLQNRYREAAFIVRRYAGEEASARA